MVSASSYRISVFLNDSKGDVTYALAPDAAWTTIELSAAVVSASFPTLGPAMITMWRNLSHTVGDGYKHNKSSRPSQGRGTATGDQGPTNSGMGSQQNLRQEDEEALYDLADFIGRYGQGASRAGANTQRPASQGAESHDGKPLSLAVTKSQDGASDEVLLNAIQVRRSVSQSSIHLP